MKEMKDILNIFKRESIEDIEKKLDSNSLDIFKIVNGLLEDPDTEIHKFIDDRYINNYKRNITVRLMESSEEVIFATEKYYIVIRVPEKAFNFLLKRFDEKHILYKKVYDNLISARRQNQIDNIKQTLNI